MAYTPFVKKTWEDEPSEETPIEASELNRLENGVSNLEASSVLYEVIGEVDETTGEIINNDQEE